MKLYGLKNCDTCRRAVSELRKAGGNVQLTDVRAEPLSPMQIDRFYQKFDADLINRRSATWRGLDDVQRQLSPTELVAQFPAVMKRPVIDAAGELYLGWGADVRAVLLG